MFGSDNWCLKHDLAHQINTSANLLISGVMLVTREGVSETRTTLGLEVLLRLFVAFLMQFSAACTALTDLKCRTQQPASVITQGLTLKYGQQAASLVYILSFGAFFRHKYVQIHK